MGAYEFATWAILSGVYSAGAVITEAALAHERTQPDPGPGRRGCGARSRARPRRTRVAMRS